jgi:hypothetical protein
VFIFGDVIVMEFALRSTVVIAQIALQPEVFNNIIKFRQKETTPHTRMNLFKHKDTFQSPLFDSTIA